MMDLAPNLRYLSLTRETHWFVRYNQTILDNLREQVQHLRVLRTFELTSKFRKGITNWDLPNLTHIITDSIPLLQAIKAPHVRVVDLLDRNDYNEWTVTGKALHRALTSFTELEELCYTLEYVQVPPSSDSDLILAPNVQCVRLRRRDSSINPVDIDGHLKGLCRHLKWLCGPALPSLKQVILYGDWANDVEAAALIQKWTPRFAARHCSLREAERESSHS
jgi:hypothetical protein